jgi:hypothetical protein
VPRAKYRNGSGLYRGAFSELRCGQGGYGGSKNGVASLAYVSAIHALRFQRAVNDVNAWQQARHDGFTAAGGASLTRRNRAPYVCPVAQVAELVDALVSGTSGESRGGSSPLLGTIAKLRFDSA